MLATSDIQLGPLLRTQIKGDVIDLFTEGYADKRARWAVNLQQDATLMVLVKSSADIAATIKFAREHSLEVAIAGGGHSLTGASSVQNGCVIDLRHMRNVRVDAERKLLHVQGGCLWSDVDIAAAKHGLATVGGTVSHTGVGGLTLGGGYGWLSGRHGLTLDNLVEATVVTADGSIVTANSKCHPDLYWALRGAGGNFGIVSEFVLRAHEQPGPVWTGQLLFSPDKIAEFVALANHWKDNRGPDENAFALLRGVPESQPDFADFKALLPAGCKTVLALLVFFNGTAEEGMRKFKPFYDLGVISDMTFEMPYVAVNSFMNPGVPHGYRRYMAPAMFTTLDLPTVQRLATDLADFITQHPKAADAVVMFELLYTNKIAEVPTTATAFPHRALAYNACLACGWEDHTLDEVITSFADGVAETISAGEARAGDKEVAKWKYLNYANARQVTDVAAAFGENYPRLREVKTRYDPHNMFGKWFAIEPLKDHSQPASK
ncbi:hypothetical protein HDU88_003426 [Geranomyces variabilis]|nr:hypothetical protein HDU88_003426 [Geranomyces variabilis]